ncbi:MAG: beta-ketoacyl synthase chain length factor [Treponema sp.]|nr:beta-ketoacyl synthase chain length factor [Treponema sp.]
MKHNEIYISRFSAWAPGIENANEWKEWAQGKREILSVTDSPQIMFADSKFRRRLSQISKMTVQVVHDLLPVNDDTKMIFLSFRGELSRQYKVNKMIIEDRSILPAAFSLSVFNAPAALASMAFGLKGGYSAIFPDTFASGISLAEAAFLCDDAEQLLFVYADENVPQEYADITEEHPWLFQPLAFGFLLTGKAEPQDSSILLSSLKKEAESPADFLKHLILSRKL